MKKYFSLQVWAIGLMGLAFGASGPVLASAPEPFPSGSIEGLFVPAGFDDNDEVVVAIDGYLDGVCYQLRTPKIEVDVAHKQIVVTPMRERVRQFCHPILISFYQMARIGSLPAGQYTVRTTDGLVHQPLSVAVASTPSQDDFPYAPVDSAFVDTQAGGKLRAVIRGRFTDTCQQLDEVRLVNSGKTLEVLPIMKITERDPHGKPCAREDRGFQSSVDLPALASGRYLLHVRSLNGQSINEVFSIPFL